MHTWRYSPHFAGGFYAGLQALTGTGLYNSLGLLATGDFFKRSVITPFYEVQGGFSHSLFLNGYGFFGNLGIGGKAFFGNSSGISVLLGYQFYRLKNDFNSRTGGSITRRRLIKGLGLRVTFHL